MISLGTSDRTPVIRVLRCEWKDLPSLSPTMSFFQENWKPFKLKILFESVQAFK